MFSRKSFRQALLREGLKAIVVIVVAGGIAFIGSSQISRSSTSLTEGRRALATLQTQQAAVGSLQEQLVKIGDADTEIEEGFVPLPSIDRPIAAIEALAGTHGLLHRALRFDTPRPLTDVTVTAPFGITRAPFTITLTGRGNDLIAYLNALERLPYFIRVDGLTITAPQDGSWNNEASVTLQGSLDFRSE
ncbi:MAG: hypothetical protein A2991_02515 [Candidatus Terrybacteria bacterium RIFCSPLOWO2_01_FULL_58_14]|uniref:Pilus assembly protein PilO n=2 Tax=Candidatus Terryibacteriota TaxID=1817920 RepID=A0A1G2PZF7_9BACT|nr:MAG: hypothetical protein A2682_01280 [Candidatus Terrybacteria bacterium RIFCSPHIGHO2_01_FULL_58_15]OHA52972.1 MAG: hypothetical protein A2991_02515 [Candidatus Terrybacteria bacterium RIFCSPLOWO2_01_FULL_58_14]